LTFPLIFVGGLVTTTDAGMAVPDWPNTYGYNMFAYPWQTWLFGPWDLFIEHGHRLLASLVGMITIGLLVTIWRTDNQIWLRRCAIAALVLVILQGVLGGVRVIENERLVAMAHGCLGPLFFALAVFLLVATSHSWHTPNAALATDAGKLACVAAALAYLQLTFGAALRHIDAAASPWAFAAILKFHLVLAAIVAGHTAVVAWRVRRAWLGVLLALVVTFQLALGVATWVMKYGLPRWATGWMPATIEATVAGGWSQTNIVTAHSATGSLLVGLLVATATLVLRQSQLARQAD